MEPATFQPVQIRWGSEQRSLVILDQTRLPEAVVERQLSTLEEIEEAIVSLRVRGAPLIGVAAAMGVAALANQRPAPTAQVESWCDRLEATRPTAVNLHWALDRMRGVARRSEEPGLAAALTVEADRILQSDRAICRQIGENALTLLRDGATVVTHCNAGALATAGIGTALAPVYLAHAQGWRLRVFVDETRPLLQGSRLTAWELLRAGIDVTVITDGMAAALIAGQRPDAVLVGADRIAANGDVANKIGTYGVALAAARHSVPFYVLAPASTIDPRTATGAQIPIEYRASDEIRRGFGRLTTPEQAGVWNPAFDVTPAELVTAIVTEAAICRPPLAPCLARAARAGTG